MPKVGAKEFPYTREGIAAAKAEAKTTGQSIKARKTYSETVHASVSRAKAGHSVDKQTGGTQAVKEGNGATSQFGGAVVGKLAGSATLKAQMGGDARIPVPASTSNAGNHSGDTSTFKAAINSPAGDGPAKPGGGSIATKAKAAGMSVHAYAHANIGSTDKETADQANYVVNALNKASKKKAGK